MLAIVDDTTYRFPLVDERSMVVAAADASAREAVIEALTALRDGKLQMKRIAGGVLSANVGTDEQPAIAPVGGEPVPVDPSWPWFCVRGLTEDDYRRARRAGGPANRLGEIIAGQVDNPARYRDALVADISIALARWLDEFEITIDGRAIQLALTDAPDDEHDVVVEAAARQLAVRLLPFVQAPGVRAAMLAEDIGDRFPELKQALVALADVHVAESLTDAEQAALDAHERRLELVNDAIARRALVRVEVGGEAWAGDDVAVLFDKLVPAARRRLREHVLIHTARISNSGKSLRGWRSRSG